MKLNKKTIIILIVVAVAGYLLWKRKKDQEVSVIESETDLDVSDPTSLSYIMSHISFTPEERAKIYAVKEALETNTAWREQLQATAYEKGRSLDQQMVLAAIWLLYTKNDKWQKGPDGTTTYGWNLQQKVLKLK